MLVGHLAVALAARRARPDQPLAVLVAATFALDLLWPVFILAGLERVAVDPGNTRFTHLAFVHYPWTHSLATACLWGIVTAAASRGGARRPSPIVGSVVVSHWLLDLISHRPDLPLWPAARWPDSACGTRSRGRSSSRAAPSSRRSRPTSVASARAVRGHGASGA